MGSGWTDQFICFLFCIIELSLNRCICFSAWCRSCWTDWFVFPLLCIYCWSAEWTDPQLHVLCIPMKLCPAVPRLKVVTLCTVGNATRCVSSPSVAPDQDPTLGPQLWRRKRRGSQFFSTKWRPKFSELPASSLAPWCCSKKLSYVSLFRLDFVCISVEHVLREAIDSQCKFGHQTTLEQTSDVFHNSFEFDNMENATKDFGSPMEFISTIQTSSRGTQWLSWGSDFLGLAQRPSLVSQMSRNCARSSRCESFVAVPQAMRSSQGHAFTHILIFSNASPPFHFLKTEDEGIWRVVCDSRHTLSLNCERCSPAKEIVLQIVEHMVCPAVSWRAKGTDAIHFAKHIHTCV